MIVMYTYAPEPTYIMQMLLLSRDLFSCSFNLKNFSQFREMDFKRLPRLYKLLNFYPPFLGAGIRVKEVNKDKTRFVAEMKLRWYNKNAAGTHFGGSLYSMCDPFYILIIHSYFGDNYIFWDKSGNIQYKIPARGTVNAVFE